MQELFGFGFAGLGAKDSGNWLLLLDGVFVYYLVKAGEFYLQRLLKQGFSGLFSLVAT